MTVSAFRGHVRYNGGVSFARRTCLLRLIFVAALYGATRTSEVDFKNFDYVWDAPPISVPTAWKWLGGRPKSSLRVVRGRHDFSPSERSAGEYVMVRSVTYGDLSGDGRDDAAVDLLYSTGGTANWHYLYVFTLGQGSPTVLGRLQSGSRADGGLVKIAIERNTLVLDFSDTKRRIADCCSEGYVRVRYRWQGDHFVEVGTRGSGDQVG